MKLMKRLPEEVMFSSDYYYKYQRCMSEVARPECDGCSVLTELTSRYALGVLSSVAITNFRKTRIKGVDQIKERKAIMQAQSELLREIGDCLGPQVVDNDMELAREKIMSFPGFTDEFREAALERIIPVAEVCGIIKADGPTA